MVLAVSDNQKVKSIGSSGEIYLGKEFAGRQVLIESPAKGFWIIRMATIIPDNETWLHEEKTKGALKKATAWAKANSAKASNLDDLPSAKQHAPKRTARKN